MTVDPYELNLLAPVMRPTNKVDELVRVLETDTDWDKPSDEIPKSQVRVINELNTMDPDYLVRFAYAALFEIERLKGLLDEAEDDPEEEPALLLTEHRCGNRWWDSETPTGCERCGEDASWAIVFEVQQGER